MTDYSYYDSFTKEWCDPSQVCPDCGGEVIDKEEIHNHHWDGIKFTCLNPECGAVYEYDDYSEAPADHRSSEW